MLLIGGVMLGIPLGLLAANATEWWFHKNVLHGAGRKKSSFWSFHWHEHHRASRRHEMHDDHYEKSIFSNNSQGKEALALAAGVVGSLPFVPIAPFFVGTLWYSAWNYYRVHKRSHLDPEWARENLPWHYDHHMGLDQDANWCVTKPWFDEIMGTRKPYVGTARELRDREKRARLLARHAAEKARRAAKAAPQAPQLEPEPKAA